MTQTLSRTEQAVSGGFFPTDYDNLEVKQIVKLLNLPQRIVLAILDDLGVEHWDHNGKAWTSRKALRDLLIHLATTR